MLTLKAGARAQWQSSMSKVLGSVFSTGKKKCANDHQEWGSMNCLICPIVVSA